MIPLEGLELNYRPNFATDLQLKNSLLPALETSYLSRFEEAEVADLSSRKIPKDRTIHKCSGFFLRGGLSILTNFSEARLGGEGHGDDIMLNVYRASKVILKSS